MNQTGYIFQDTQDKSEWKRLKSIEAIFDPATRRRLLSAGLRYGSRCLEVGAGAGSVMTWMAEKVGLSGNVTAVDLNPRFLKDPPANVRVVDGDIRTFPLEPESFDLLHTRYVLVHIPESQGVLERLWKALKPGGSLVVEEPDFSVFRALDGLEEEVRSFEKVHRAVLHLFSSQGVDFALGARLPALFRRLGAKDIQMENDSPASQGGSPMALMMEQSAAHLKEKYLATGLVTVQDLENYGKFAHNPHSWAVYYATLAAIGKKF